MTGKQLPRGALLVAAALLIPTLARAETTLSIDPPSLAVGETGRLIVTTDATEEPPDAPRVDGLRIEPVGTSTRVTIVNGAIEKVTQFAFSVTPRRSGQFTIPAMNVGGDQTEPLSLVAGGASARPVPVAPAARSEAVDQRSADRRAFIRVSAPSKAAVVGQAIETTIRAYFRADTGVSVNGEPRIASSAFTITPIGDATRGETEIDGVPHNVLTWRAVLVPAMAGTHKLEVELPATLEYREPAPARERSRSLFDVFGDDPFGDSFFDDSLFGGSAQEMLEDMLGALGPVQRREVTLRHSAGELVATAPPVDGRPPEFAGAIGKFSVASELASTKLTAGEPTTLTIRVSGEGNFDSLGSVALARSAEWSTYPAKAVSGPSADSPLRGTKVFEQLVVPKSEHVTTLPPITLSFYDPKAARYAEAASSAITVEVTRGAGTSAAPAGPLTDQTPRDGRSERGPGAVVSFEPLYQRPVFIAFPLAALAIMLVPLARAFAKRREGRRASRDALRKLDRAAGSGDARAFFFAARDVLRERLADRWQVRPDSVTTSDVRARLTDPDAAATIVLFDLAERADYGDDALPNDLEHWNQVAREQLALLEEP